MPRAEPVNSLSLDWPWAASASSNVGPLFVAHTFHQPKHASSTHLQASTAIKQQELEALEAEQAEHSSAVERRLAEAECRAAESQAACEDAQAQLLAAREHQQELSRQVYVAEQAEQQLRAKVGGPCCGMAGHARKGDACYQNKCWQDCCTQARGVRSHSSRGDMPRCSATP